MGLLDSILGSMGGGDPATGGTSNSAPSGNAVVQAIGDLIKQHGGVSGMAGQFSKQGLGGVFSSWVKDGPNASISPGEVHQAVGQDQVSSIANRLGIDPTLATMLIAQFLPRIIDHLTPNGQHEPAQDNPGSIQSILQSGLGKLLGH